MSEVIDIPKGHKLTKAGIIPTDWTSGKVGDLFDFISSYSNSRSELTDDSNEGTIKYIHYGDIHSKFNFQVIDIEHERIPYLRNDISNKKGFKFLQDGDVVLADASEDYEGVAECIELKSIGNQKIIGGLHTIVLRDNSDHTSLGFRSYIFSNHSVRKVLMKIATGISVYGISKGNLSKVFVPLPPINEQTKIASILTTWDRAIETTQSIIDDLKLRNKGLAQQLLTGKKRLKGFDGEWRKDKLGNLLKEIKSKPVENPKLYELITVKLYGKGIKNTGKFPKKTKSGRSYHFRNEGEIIIGRQNFHNGSIALMPRFKSKMIASNAISSFSTAKEIDYKWILHYLLRPSFYLWVENLIGGTGQKEINRRDFNNISIVIPPIKEQKSIAKILLGSDNEINIYKKNLATLKEQKKGLMQKLLTGEVRVKMSKQDFKD